MLSSCNGVESLQLMNNHSVFRVGIYYMYVNPFEPREGVRQQQRSQSSVKQVDS